MSSGEEKCRDSKESSLSQFHHFRCYIDLQYVDVGLISLNIIQVIFQGRL